MNFRRATISSLVSWIELLLSTRVDLLNQGNFYMGLVNPENRVDSPAEAAD